MSEYQETADDGFHEIQLSGKQVVFLVMVATVASAVIFLSGVMVGRGVRAQRGDVEPEPIAGASAAPTPAPDVAAPAAGAEPPAPPTETPDELSYTKRLQGETPAAETLKPREEQPAAPAAAPPAASTPAATPPAAPPATAPASGTVPTQGRAGAWVVQVTALSNPAAARDVVQQLAGKGYPAFLVNPAPGMPAIYRVQVGGYGNRSEADAVARRLEKEENHKPVVRQNR